jgi:hypothetical protein
MVAVMCSLRRPSKASNENALHGLIQLARLTAISLVLTADSRIVVLAYVRSLRR